MTRRLGPLLALLLLIWGCTQSHGEAYLPGQCSDGLDNDGDGSSDCEDQDCAGAPDCAPTASLNGCTETPAGASCLVIAELTLEPAQVRPGETFSVSVWIPHATAENVVLEIAATPIEPALELAAADGGLRGNYSANAELPLGDHLVALRADVEDGEAQAYALLSVTEQQSCDDGLVREAGICVPSHSGVAIAPDRMFHTPYAGQITGLPEGGKERMMLHPRRVFAVENALVSCLTDSVAIIDPEAMFPIATDASPFDPRPPPLMERAEGVLDPDGLALCDDLALDAEAEIAVTMTRGALGQPAGLTSWRLPDLTSPPFDDPIELQSWIDASGFETGVFDDGYLYVAGKPDRLSVFTVNEQGAFTLVHEQQLPGCTGSWSVIKAGDRLYLTDAGVHPERGDGQPQGGSLYVFDASDPAAPMLQSSVPTWGLGKSLAVSSDGRVALAGGEAGLEIFDVSMIDAPVLSEHIDTPGSAISVAWSDGYLLLSDWNSMRLYDASEPGNTRLISATDLALTQLSGAEQDPQWAIDNSGFVALSGTDFIITEMDTIFLGTLQPGARTGSLNVIDRRWSISASSERQDQAFVLRLRNGGRQALELSIRQQNGLTPSGQRYLIAPGQQQALELQARGLLDNPALRFVTLDAEDPMQPERRAALVVLEGGLATGDPIPSFRLPFTNRCEGELCSQEVNCFHLDDSQWEGMPILLAFYSSW
ncbi:MAG: hypothetical protein CMP23_10775 [Rickettsiales bacterium]|nr:hypothetical protein [Rickettsiales bacterium]